MAAQLAGFDEGTAGRLALAVDEAATNVIEHAYRRGQRPGVRGPLRGPGPEFRVEVIDTGAMVDPRSFPSVDLERYSDASGARAASASI